MANVQISIAPKPNASAACTGFDESKGADSRAPILGRDRIAMNLHVAKTTIGTKRIAPTIPTDTNLHGTTSAHAPRHLTPCALSQRAEIRARKVGHLLYWRGTCSAEIDNGRRETLRRRHRTYPAAGHLGCSSTRRPTGGSELRAIATIPV